MAIERDLRDRMELELAGYRSARHLSECVRWIFWDDNMDRALAQGYFERVDNGTYKVSYSYRLTPKGMAELKKAGPGFTYGDADGRITITYRQGEAWRSRCIKVGGKQKRERAERLLSVFESLVTDAGAHDRLALEKEGWFPSKTTEPCHSLVEAGLVERIERGSERAVAYYRLSAKGKTVLIAASRHKLLAKQEADRLAYERELEASRQKFEEDAIAGRARLLKVQADDRRRLPRTIDVRDWPDFPGWQD